MRGSPALLLALAAPLFLGRAEPPVAEEPEEAVAMQTVARLREAACTSSPPAGDSRAAGGSAEGEEMALLQRPTQGRATEAEAGDQMVPADGEEMALLQTPKQRHATEAEHEAAPASQAARHQEKAAGRRAKGRRYLPGVHAKAVEEAFNAVLAQGGALAAVLKKYEQAGMQKKTEGTCDLSSCYASRGMTDCLGGECLCQDGYGTQDGAKCIERYSQPLADFETDTGGTCGWLSCSSSRGPTECRDGKCVCQDGYFADEGKCVPPSRVDPGKEVIQTMLLAGVREPDELPCPGDTLEEGTMNNALIKMALGDEHFNVSLCRTATQVYHASPLPMVDKKDLFDPPEENGYQKEDNAVEGLYSVMTMRQWRTHIVKIMATEFVYAITMPDLGEGAKRLGNIFHTLSDGFSASHVVRASSSSSKPATAESCGALIPDLPMSMDVMNFVVHPFADMKDDDILFACSSFYEEVAIRIWAEARLAGVTSLSGANAWVDRVVNEVFCPAFPVSADALDSPAGGANTFYSADLSKPAMPMGTASEKDAYRIIVGWASGLAAKRATESPSVQRSYPLGLVVPPRSEDVCASSTLAHVEARHFEAARDSQLPPQYLQPYF